MIKYLITLGSYTLLMAISLTTSHANNIELYIKNENKTNISDAKHFGVNLTKDHIGPFNTLIVGYEHRQWPLTDVRKGNSLFLTGYYNINNKHDWVGVSQLQVGDSSLFPRLTVYQDISYKYGQHRNTLLGLGLGFQRYHDNHTDTFYKIGPTTYFSNGSASYKYGQYIDSKSSNHNISANYKPWDDLTVNIAHTFGQSFQYDNADTFTIPSKNKGSDTQLKFTYHTNNVLSVYTTLGYTVSDDTTTNKNNYKSRNVGVGIIYNLD